ncbi:MAG TPA: hypothetical protein VNU71_18295 [Burkholderiaceae bacterium]|nr:hypothetical protein [Burkholderiaceae bacterium]
MLTAIAGIVAVESNVCLNSAHAASLLGGSAPRPAPIDPREIDAMRDAFLFDPDLVFLNHGSFGGPCERLSCAAPPAFAR